MKKIGRMFGPFTSKATLPLFDIEMSRADIFQALDYVSDKLRGRGHHITLIATGPALSCLLLKTTQHCSSIPIIPASSLTPSQMACLANAVQKATKKFRLGVNWLNNRDQAKLLKMSYLNSVVHRSLLQNEVLYSSEGLTLLAVDYTFALKGMLEHLSTASPLHTSSSASMTLLEDAVCILHHLVVASRGRPLTKGFLSKCYPRLEMTDAALMRLGACYEWKYNSRGISGVNDEWLEWRREGRVDIDVDLANWGLGITIGNEYENSIDGGDSRRSSGVEGFEEKGKGKFKEVSPPNSIPMVSPYAINYGLEEMESEPNSRACSPNPKNVAGKWNVEQFLRAFNDTPEL